MNVGLTEQLARLSHRHAQERVLPTSTTAARGTTLVEHLQRLHRRRPSNPSTSRLLTLSTSSSIELLMLLHRIPFIQRFVRQLLVLARERSKHTAEQIAVATTLRVLLGVLGRLAEVIAVAAASATVRRACGLAVPGAGLLAAAVGAFLAAVIGLVAEALLTAAVVLHRSVSELTLQ